MKKKALHSFLVLLYLLVIVKLPAQIHVCFASMSETSCCTDLGCTKDADKTSSLSFESNCCADVQSNNLIETEHQLIKEAAVSSTTEIINDGQSSLFNYKLTENVELKKLLCYFKSFSPPIKPLYKVYNQFVIYHV